MNSKSTTYENDSYNLCCGEVGNSKFSVVYRNIENPNFMHGQVTQWLYVKHGGSGSVVIDGEEQINFVSNDFVKIPNLKNKKVIWSGTGSWVSFNPIPYEDNYDAYKLIVTPQEATTLEPVNYERVCVVFEGSVTVTNQQGTTKNLTENKSFIILPQSTVTIISANDAVLGIFYKQ